MITFTTESGGAYEYRPSTQQWRRIGGPRNTFMSRSDFDWHPGVIDLEVGQSAIIRDPATRNAMRVTTPIKEIVQ